MHRIIGLRGAPLRRRAPQPRPPRALPPAVRRLPRLRRRHVRVEGRRAGN